MKTRISKRGILILLMVWTGILLTGCGDFDASRYVKSCLDASFHGEFTDYIEMTNSSEEDARSAYDKLIQSEVDSLENGYTISDEQKDKFRSLFVQMYQACKYEVGEAVQNENDTYTVPVTTYQLCVFTGMDDATEQYATEYVKEHSDASSDEIYSALLDYMYDYIKERVDNPTYADGVSQELTVSLTSTNPKVYTLATGDLQNIVYKLLDLSK